MIFLSKNVGINFIRKYLLIFIKVLRKVLKDFFEIGY